MGDTALKGFTFVQIPMWLIACKDVEAQAKVVYGYLVWRQGRNAGCWPSVDKIARDLQLNRRSVLRHLEQLEGLGYIQIERSPGLSNTYTIDGEPPGKVKVSEALAVELKLAVATTGSDTAVTSDTHVTSDTDVTAPVTPVSPHQCHPCHPNYINEPYKRTRNKDQPKSSAPLAIVAFREVTKYCPAPGSPMWEEIAKVPGDAQTLDRWREVIRQWLLRGFSSRNISGMLDWLEHGIPARGPRGARKPAAAPLKDEPWYRDAVRATEERWEREHPS